MDPNYPMDHRAMEAQRDETVMTLLVAESKGFILRCASKVCKRFITDSDDEYEEAVCISENVFGKNFSDPLFFHRTLRNIG